MLNKPNRQRPDPRFLDELFEAGAHLFPLVAHDDQSVDLRARGKRAWRKGWNSPDARPLTREEAVTHMRAGRNLGERINPEDLVIDVDPRHFGDETDYSDPNKASSAALRALDEWCHDHGFDRSGWPICVTGSGGLHVRLRKPADLPIVTKLADRPGFEIKTAGTFIVTPGSVHPLTGRLYQPYSKGVRLKDAPLAPTALLDLLRRPQAEESVTGDGELEPEQLAELLALLDPVDYGEGKYEAWIRLAAAAHDATGGAGLEAFTAWCTRDPAYADAAEMIEHHWNSFTAGKAGGVTYRTLFKAVANADRPDLVARRGEADEPIEDDVLVFELDEDDGDEAND